jgi:hypothetical protein
MSRCSSPKVYVELTKSVIQIVIFPGFINIPLGRHWKTWINIIDGFIIVILGYLGLSF